MQGSDIEYALKVAHENNVKFIRLWFTDNAMHGGPFGKDRTRIVSYTAVLQQALRSVKS